MRLDFLKKKNKAAAENGKDIYTLDKQGIQEQRAIMVKSFLKNRLAVISLVVLVILIIAALLAPVITSGEVYAVRPSNRLKPPSAANLFGTDLLGRDLFTRSIYGLRISLAIGFFTAMITMAIGLFLGLLASYFELLDNIIMRFLEAMMAIPNTLLAIALMTLLGVTTQNVIFSIAAVSTPAMARLARSTALSIKSMLYIEAAKSQGTKWPRILFRHIMPNILSPIIVQATYVFANATITEASLSFIGVGVPVPDPSLGNILFEAKSVLHSSWWMVLFPGILMILAVLSINILGDGIRDMLDPKLSNR